MRILACLLFLLAIFTFGCQRQPLFNQTGAAIIESAKGLPGEIYLTRGADGPYFVGPTAVGGENSEGSFYATTKKGRQPEVSWPATPGFYYEVWSYINRSDEVFYVVRKIPAEKRP